MPQLAGTAASTEQADSCQTDPNRHGGAQAEPESLGGNTIER